MGHHLGHVWALSGARLGYHLEHLGHIVNNVQQSAVLHASVMPFLSKYLTVVSCAEIFGKQLLGALQC